MKTTFTTLLLGVTTLLSAQTTINLSPERDNTIYSSFADNSNGAGEYLFVGCNAASNQNSIQRALLYFNLSGIPAGSTITSATLKLYVDKSGPVGTAMQLYKATALWGEGTFDADGREASGASATINDATWNMRLNLSAAWSTAGGDFVASTSATSAAVPGFLNSSTLVAMENSLAGSVAEDVQDWVNNPQGNFGWVLRSANESASASVKRILSRENAQTAQRPVLTVSYTPGTVPVVLKYFKAVLQKDAALLSWATASEVNNKYFDVQHSSNGINYKSIARVNGAGNTVVEQQYTFTHTNLQPGRNYYRLLQVDEDGNSKLSQVTQVNSLATRQLTVWPNPAANHLNVTTGNAGAMVKYTIRSRTGELVQSGVLAATPLNISLLKSGLYHLVVHYANKTKEATTFIKK